MKKWSSIVLLMFLLNCADDPTYKDVGDIPFDATLDDQNFQICNEKNIKQYYVRRSSDSPPGYQGEKIALDKQILDQYNFPDTKSENGYITIRFIINCKGEMGRFRVEEMNHSYEPVSFDDNIVKQLLTIVKSLDGWIPRKSNDKAIDIYQYLTFKIKNGQIIKILP